MLGEGIALIELFGDSPAECIVDEFKTSRAIDGFHNPVFRIPGVSPGTILGHVAVIVVLRRDGAAAHDINSGVLVQAVCAIGLRGWILVGTGPVSDVVETIAHGVLRDVGSVFADCACDFGPLIVGVVPGGTVLKRGRLPATEGTERSFATPVQTIPVETAGLHRGQARQRISSGFCSLSSHLDLAA